MGPVESRPPDGLEHRVRVRSELRQVRLDCRPETNFSTRVKHQRLNDVDDFIEGVSIDCNSAEFDAGFVCLLCGVEIHGGRLQDLNGLGKLVSGLVGSGFLEDDGDRFENNF